ncbi:MAG: hypothetical protein AAF213_07280 [Pseudomonadota bacterium]
MALAASSPKTRRPIDVAVAVDWQDRRAVNALMRRLEQTLSPDLLIDKYTKSARYQKLNPTTGHCSAASEALWYMIGNWATTYRDHWAYDTPQARGRQARGEKRADTDTTHHWLQIPGTVPEKQRNLFDPTVKQYEHQQHPHGRIVRKTTPHAYGIAAGFQTKWPSKRAQAVIDRVANTLLKRPLKGVVVDPTLIRDPEASRHKAYDEKLYRGLAQFYEARIEAPVKPVRPARVLPGRGGHDARSQPPVGHGPTSAPALPSLRAS